MNRLTRFTVSTLAAVLGVAIAAPATADPTNHNDVFTVACDNGITYQAVGGGNGHFTPAHDVASNTILVPTAFGEVHGTTTDSHGTVIDEFTEPPSAKGNSTRDRRTSTNCTFNFGGTFEDPDLGTLTFAGSGTVTGFTTPAS